MKEGRLRGHDAVSQGEYPFSFAHDRVDHLCFASFGAAGDGGEPEKEHLEKRINTKRRYEIGKWKCG